MSGADLSEPGEFRDLRDLAIREVVQLLDEHESVKLESSFSALTPAQQAEILDLQAAVAREINAAGEESPDRSLRYRVLARVAEAIERDNEAVAPIASIGRLGAHASSASVFPNPADPDGVAPDQDDSVRHERTTRSWSAMRNELGWRAAALVFGASLVVLGVIHWQTAETLDRFERYVISELSLQQLIEENPEMSQYAGILRSSTRRDHPLVSKVGLGSANVIYEPATKSSMFQGVLMINQLADATSSVQLMIRDADGLETMVQEVSLSPNGHITADRVALDQNLLAPTSVFILRDSESGDLLLESGRFGA